jgi:hypothetical protein
MATKGMVRTAGTDVDEYLRGLYAELQGQLNEPQNDPDVLRLWAMAGPDGVIRTEELCCVCDAAGFIHVRQLADMGNGE